jgi:hypothetical protein
VSPSFPKLSADYTFERGAAAGDWQPSRRSLWWDVLRENIFPPARNRKKAQLIDL